MTSSCRCGQFASVNYLDAVKHYTAALTRDPGTPTPKLRMGTAAEFQEWKQEMRAHDAARLALGLATARQIHLENAIIPPQHGRAHIVTHALHGRAAQAV